MVVTTVGMLVGSLVLWEENVWSHWRVKSLEHIFYSPS